MRQQLENSKASEAEKRERENTMKVVKTNFKPVLVSYIKLDKKGEGRYANWKTTRIVPLGIETYKTEYMD